MSFISKHSGEDGGGGRARRGQKAEQGQRRCQARPLVWHTPCPLAAVPPAQHTAHPAPGCPGMLRIPPSGGTGLILPPQSEVCRDCHPNLPVF